MDEQEARELICALYETQRRGLLRYLVHSGAPINQAEDIVQEAFMHAYMAIRAGKDIDNLRAWLFTAARHAHWKLLSSEQRTHQLDDETLASLSSKDPPLNDGSDRDELDHLLYLLTPRERQVTLLRLSSLKYREIAECLGISTKTAHTLLTRALKRLQQAAQSKPEERMVQLPYVLKTTDTLQ